VNPVIVPANGALTDKVVDHLFPRVRMLIAVREDLLVGLSGEFDLGRIGHKALARMAGY
jgi:hypothetical protein